MNKGRVMIAAPKSGSGKTSVTIALLENLKKRNVKVCSFKCGPDYIDPLFHKSVLGIPSFNLDTFFTDEKTTREIFEIHSSDYDFAVMEGVMGLFDGLGGIREEGSSYHLARVTKTPVILVVDAKGACKSIIPMIAGFKAYDKEDLIKGVILNRTSESVFNIVAPLIEKELSIKALGFIPEKKDAIIPSRHLGLFTPDDEEKVRNVIEILSAEFVKNVSFDEIEKIAAGDGCLISDAANINLKDNDDRNNILKDSENVKRGMDVEIKNAQCTIAVSKDEAFCFLYEDNIRLLEENGADIVYFSPLHDEAVPKDADAILLTGGYPEEYLEALSKNKSMMDSIKELHGKNIPIVAECGGFMYLHKTIEDRDKERYETVGIIDANCVFTGKSVRFGYIEIKEKKASFLNGEAIKGHEFHYYDSERNGDSCIVTKPVSGKQYESIIENDNMFVGFPHLYYPSNPSFAKNFVKKGVDFKNKRQR